MYIFSFQSIVTVMYPYPRRSPPDGYPGYLSGRQPLPPRPSPPPMRQFPVTSSQPRGPSEFRRPDSYLNPRGAQLSPPPRGHPPPRPSQVSPPPSLGYASRTYPQSSSHLPRFGSHPQSSAPLYRAPSCQSSDIVTYSISRSPAQLLPSRGYSTLTQQSTEQRLSTPSYLSSGRFSSPQPRYSHSHPQSSPGFSPPTQSQQLRFSLTAQSPQSRFIQPPHFPQRIPRPSPPQQRIPTTSSNEISRMSYQQRFPTSPNQPRVSTTFPQQGLDLSTSVIAGISKPHQGRFVTPSQSPQQRFSTGRSPHDAVRGPLHNQGLRSQSTSGINLVFNLNF